MYLLYSFALTLGFLILLPKFLVDAIRHGKYASSLGQRLGNIPAIDRARRPVIWLHSVSVGETQAARPLVTEIIGRFPTSSVVVSTTTLTGQAVARTAFGGVAASVFYFPIDWAWTVRRSLERVQPDLVLVMETEIWPNFLRECRRAGIPVAIVNGRLSTTSFSRYKWIHGFMRRVLQNVSHASMQAEGDAERLRKLGMPSDLMVVTGNLKFDFPTGDVSDGNVNPTIERFGFGDGRPLIVAASTHDREEEVILNAYTQLRSSFAGNSPRLLIAPRHPERFEEAAGLIERSNFSWARRSGPRSEGDRTTDVVLLDSIGELRSIFPVADLVFVAGSISPNGGHNVLEPAAYGKCVVTGRHTENFAAIVAEMTRFGAIVQLDQEEPSSVAEELAGVFIDLLQDSEKRRALGDAALKVVAANQGATKLTVDRIEQLLQPARRKTESISHEQAVNASRLP